MAVHPMASSLTALTALSERAEADRTRMIAAIDNMSAQLTPLITQVATQGFAITDHVRDCDRLSREQSGLATERHRENTAKLDKVDSQIIRIDTRTKRVEIIYAALGFVGIVGAALLTFAATPIGSRFLHWLIGTPT